MLRQALDWFRYWQEGLLWERDMWQERLHLLEVDKDSEGFNVEQRFLKERLEIVDLKINELYRRMGKL